MTPRKTALFIGRFQPFHKGHLDAIQQILSENDHIIIGIGSANKSGTPENPLPLATRLQQIESALLKSKILPTKFTLLPIDDLDNYAQWPAHVGDLLKNSKLHPTTLYTGSKLVTDCFLGHYSNPGQKSRIPKLKIHPLTKNLPISATKIRQLQEEGEEWEHLVP